MFHLNALAELGDSKDFHTYELRLVSLRAMQAVASLENFMDENVQNRIAWIWNCILGNARHTEKVKLKSKEKVLRRLSIVPQPTVILDEKRNQELVFDSLSHYATLCLQTLLTRANSTTVDIVINPLLINLDEKNQWEDMEFCIRLFDNVRSVLPIRNRAMVSIQFLTRLGSKASMRHGHVVSYLKILIKLLSTSHISSFPIIKLVDSLVGLYLHYIDDDDLKNHKDLILKCLEITGENSNLTVQLSDGLHYMVDLMKPDESSPAHPGTNEILTCFKELLKHPLPTDSSFLNYADTAVMLANMCVTDPKFRDELLNSLLLLMRRISDLALSSDDLELQNKDIDLIYEAFYNVLSTNPSDGVVARIFYGLLVTMKIFGQHHSAINSSILCLCDVFSATKTDGGIFQSAKINSIIIQFFSSISKSLGNNSAHKYIEKLKFGCKSEGYWWDFAQVHEKEYYSMKCEEIDNALKAEDFEVVPSSLQIDIKELKSYFSSQN